jgi:hypothetical protein
MSDKAHIHLFGYVSGHNILYWCQENPSEMHESSVPSVKEAGWCGVTSSVIIQPHILGEEQLDTATVNAKRYQDTLENFMAADRRRLCCAKHMVQHGYHIQYIHSFCRYSAKHFSRTFNFSIHRYFLVYANYRPDEP